MIDKTLSPVGLKTGQFGLRGLMVFTFSVSLGLSALEPGGRNAGDCVLVVATIWILLGLINQAWDLYSAYRSRSDLTADCRWGWRFAMAWRVVAAIVLLATSLAGVLVSRKLVALEWDNSIFFAPYWWSCSIPWLSSLSFSVPHDPWSCAGSHGCHVRSSCSHGLQHPHGAFWNGAGNFGPVPRLLCGNRHRAGHAAPLRLPRNRRDVSAADRFFVWTTLATAIGVVNIVLAARFPHWWSRGKRARWIAASLLTAGLAASGSYLAWLITAGLRELSPPVAEVAMVGPRWRWLLALGIAVFLATYAAYRAARLPSDRDVRVALPWRRRPDAYYHQQFAVIALVIAALAITVGMSFYPLFSSGSFVASLVECLESWCLTDYLYTAVVLAAAGAMSRHVGVCAAVLCRLIPPALPVGQFMATWLAVLISDLEPSCHRRHDFFDLAHIMALVALTFCPDLLLERTAGHPGGQHAATSFVHFRLKSILRRTNAWAR